MLRVFILIVSLLLPAVSAAGDRPNLLIMGDDSDTDSIPGDSRVFNRVVNALANQMNGMGFDVYDEGKVTGGHYYKAGVRRSDTELIAIANSVQQPPIDIAVIFTIYASIENNGYMNKVKSRIEGRLLQVKSGKRLGNFEMKNPQSWTAPAKCSRECVLETVGEYSKILAQDVGAVLAENLAWLVGDESTNVNQLSAGYNLLFHNYSPEEVMNMEEYLKIFSGYESHRPVLSTPKKSEIWYQSTITSAKLNTNLKKMLSALELKGTVLFSGNTYTIRKSSSKTKKVLKPVDGDW